MSLVELIKNEPTTTSLVIAEGVGTVHKNVMALLTAHFVDDPELAFKTRFLKNPQGQDTKYALLNEDQTLYLITLMRNSDTVKKFKRALVKDFLRMRDHLECRSSGKGIYRQKTAVIADFVSYATSQGSTSAKMYFSNLANMENRALFLLEQKYPNVRDVLNTKQLMCVAVADDIVEKALLEGMERGMAYKEIYLLAKDRIVQYGTLIGRSPVASFFENPENSENLKLPKI